MTTNEERELIREYKCLIMRVGLGFHPDTPFDDYEPPIDFMSEEQFDRIVHGVFEIPNFDPYEEGLEIFELIASAIK